MCVYVCVCLHFVSNIYVYYIYILSESTDIQNISHIGHVICIHMPIFAKSGLGRQEGDQNQQPSCL